jgi:hypothetical protein
MLRRAHYLCCPHQSVVLTTSHPARTRCVKHHRPSLEQLELRKVLRTTRADADAHHTLSTDAVCMYSIANRAVE